MKMSGIYELIRWLNQRHNLTGYSWHNEKDKIVITIKKED